jgi:hypothetical protein
MAAGQITQQETLMSDRYALRWCPGCNARAVTAPLPQLAEDAELSRPLRAGEATEGFFRRNYCTACGHIWESVELPQPFVQSLLALEEELEEQRRQVAMLKFLLASERKARSEGVPAPATTPLKVAQTGRRNAA